MAIQFNISKNLAQSSLASGYTAGNTSITVQTGDGSKFDAAPFVVAVGNPPQFFLKVTAVSGDTFTVDTSGFDGSTAVSVTSSTKITEVVTFGVLQALLAGPLNPTKSSDFSWVNQSSATVADGWGGFDMLAPPGGSDNINLLITALPSPPYTVIARVSVTFAPGNFSSAGMILREATSGHLITFGQGQNSGPKNVAQLYTSPTVYAGGSDPFVASALTVGLNLWLKLVDDGTHRTYYVAQGPTGWIQMAQTGNTTYITPSHVGFYVNANNSTTSPVGLRVDSFQITTP